MYNTGGKDTAWQTAACFLWCKLPHAPYDVNWWTTVGHAILWRNPDLVERFSRVGAQVDGAAIPQGTALQYAVPMGGLRAVVDTLLYHGADAQKDKES